MKSRTYEFLVSRVTVIVEADDFKEARQLRDEMLAEVAVSWGDSELIASGESGPIAFKESDLIVPDGTD